MDLKTGFVTKWKEGRSNTGRSCFRSCVSICLFTGEVGGGGSPPYMALARDLLFTIKTGDSHKTPLMPDILQGLWWQEDSTTDLRLCHVYLLFILIYVMLIRVKNRLFD